jgi:hypothetical protein
MSFSSFGSDAFCAVATSQQTKSDSAAAVITSLFRISISG